MIQCVYMPSPELGGGPPDPENQPRHELEPVPYVRAALFADELTAKTAYFAAEETVRVAQTECDLSVYRLLLAHVSHVAVIGEPPPTEVDASLRTILATGEPATLPRGVLLALAQRRQQAT